MKKIALFVKKSVKWFFIISIGLVILFRFVPVPFTPLMAIRPVENLINGKEIFYSHDWVSIDEISPNMVSAVIASEDQIFLDHYGFDIESMKKAYEGNKKGKKIKGGSTITQQTAKNVFLWQGRSYIRKIFEAYFTVLIEIFWSKERIVEVYLNSIEMGNGIYGVQAASRHWFQKDAKNLTAQEAASIAAILPNPRFYKARNSSYYINKRVRWITRQMRNLGSVEF
jgi:monofunctional biosynthetic peptidoglycan transglycosylase